MFPEKPMEPLTPEQWREFIGVRECMPHLLRILRTMGRKGKGIIATTLRNTGALLIKSATFGK